jgi:6-phosphogluconolactonase
MEMKAYLYIGTYTEAEPGKPGRTEGIFTCTLDQQTGQMEIIAATGGIENPSYLAIDRKARYLYAISEGYKFQGKPGGGIGAYRIDPISGALVLLNQQPTYNSLSCYVSLDETGKFAWVSNYEDPSLTVFPIFPDGTVGSARAILPIVGNGPNPERQEHAHTHCVVLDPQGSYVLAADLGIDRILVFDSQAVYRDGNVPPYSDAATAPGAGPRHIAFHPNQSYVYVCNELDSTVSGFDYSHSNGTLALRQTVSTLPDGFSETNYPADIHVHPSGRFLYVSNRGHDSIAMYQIDPATLLLTSLGYTSTFGKWPRNFAISPDGNMLIAANQLSDSVFTYFIDSTSGNLSPTGYRLDMPKPVCIQFSPVQ